MKRFQILAHRGHWIAPSEKNSVLALERALSSGYGVETDIRDYGSNLVISHDMPSPEMDLLSFNDFLNLYRENDSSGVLALNIKSDGLATAVKHALDHYQIDNYFVFDMSIPDTLAYLNADLEVFTRVSEYEFPPSFIQQATGIWVDHFSGRQEQVEWAQDFLQAKQTVAFVSPELHKRAHLDIWAKLRPIVESDVSNNFLLCTDLPDRAMEFFEIEG